MVHGVGHALPALQVVPAIDTHFRDAYTVWTNAANKLQSAHDAVSARYLRSVVEWLRYKPTLVALANAPLTPRHWHELWLCMGTPYVRDFTLGDLIKHGAFDHAEAICTFTAGAADEFALEAQLEVTSASTRALPSGHVPDARVHRACVMGRFRPPIQRKPGVSLAGSVPTACCRSCNR